MLKIASYLLAFSTILGAQAYADGSPTDAESGHTSFNSKSFTGRITRDRVRLRLQPTVESPVIKELERGKMLLVTGEENDFYAVKPISGTKTYIYRTYVLDGVVEGNKVNVRIDPHLEAPVIAQLSTGDRVDGKISGRNSKWLEIDPPANTRLYVSADFVEKIGDANYIVRFEERLNDVNNLLNGTYLVSQQEIQKPFSEIEPERVEENYSRIISDYTEFPEQVRTAKKYLHQFKDAYLHKKVKYLEERSTTSTAPWNTQREESIVRNERLNEQENSRQQTNDSQNSTDTYKAWIHKKKTSEMNARMALWIPVEISYYEEWAKKNGEQPIQNFYEEQRGSSHALRGVLEHYDRPVRNKPGDYLLVNRGNRLPIAYIYSTQVNLQELVGQDVTVEGVLRPNNNFAYPAYFIMSVE